MVDGAVSTFVATSDGVRYKARVIGITYNADIALLKIDAPRGTQAAVFGDSDKLHIGDKVIAIGSPFGFDNSVTTGVVSKWERGEKQPRGPAAKLLSLAAKRGIAAIA